MSGTNAKENTGLNFQLSPLLLGSLVSGIAATIAVVAFAALTMAPHPPPPPGGGAPPPPPGTTGLTISVGCFAAAWIAVIVAHARDQVLRRVESAQAATRALVEDLAERRETDGFLRGMRTAGAPHSDVRPLHRVPPPSAPAD